MMDTKIANKPRKRNAEVAARVKKTAELTGFTMNYVYKVINGERKNEHVMNVYMFLYEGGNNLVKAAKELVPFN